MVCCGCVGVIYGRFFSWGGDGVCLKNCVCSWLFVLKKKGFPNWVVSYIKKKEKVHPICWSSKISLYVSLAKKKKICSPTSIWGRI
jgi:hypothetical protein